MCDDGRVAELEQVPGGEGGAGDLVDGDDRQGVPGPASTATSGRSRGSATSASPAPSSGAMTRMPSTPGMRSRSRR